MISIIFGTYNRIGKLKDAVASINVAAQQISEIPEIIILDGGSTDGTLEWLATQTNIIVINEGGLHGVTRAYNRGFRLASKKYITWFSDDFKYHPNALKVLEENLKLCDENTLLSLSIDVGDGKGFINYAPNTPIGAGHKTLFKKVDYWSEDFITYASDNDFSMKIALSGGKVIPIDARIIHNIDLRDNLHTENLSNNQCSTRYVELYKTGTNGWNKTYPNIWINAISAEELFKKLHQARMTIGWCNFYTDNFFNYDLLFSSMNVSIASKTNHYAKVI